MTEKQIGFAPCPDHSVNGAAFDGDKQRALLTHALACQNQGTFDLIDAPSNGPSCLQGVYRYCAIGSGCIPLLERVRDCAIDALRSRQGIQVDFGEFRWRPHPNVLVLVAPHLPASFFDERQGPYSDGALISKVFDRIVVLHCTRDRALPPGQDMGRVGPSGDLPANLTAIDITPLLEFSQDAVYGAFCSCECLFLIAQLLLGVAPKAALPHALKS